MEREGFVSLFIGNSNSYEELQKYVSGNCTEDGDTIPSQFEEDFGIDYYDDDFREIEFYSESSDDLRILLEGFSYDEKIVSEFIDICGDRLDRKVNSVILLYDFQYIGNIDRASQFQFLGTVQYK
ncbi:MAG: immunity 22 family protein [Thermoactinomyces sp.]